MPKTTTNAKVDAFLDKAEKWREEFKKLRAIILDCGLFEELKWGVPCYSFNGGNVVLIHGFKEYCTILFIKGALLKDAKGVLIQQTENVQAGRQIRFTNVQEIVKIEPVLKAYIHEAIEVEKAGLKVDLKRTSDFKIPVEFKRKLDDNPGLKTAFEALTPGRQRAYLFYFSQPKQSETRESRVDKCVQRILKGKGLND
ncbi:MAG TPA: YdeI family protein [Chitinivibrionales bacterium]|nr:YdeI family protein [Chitinivibrionales bacterium]